MSKSRLVEIPFSDWPALADLYAERQQYANSYNLIKNFCGWPRDCPEFELTFLSLDGVWRKDGTFICRYRKAHEVSIFCNTLSENKERLIEAFNNLDTSEEYHFKAFPEYLKDSFVKHFIDLGLSEEDFRPTETYWYNISREKIEKFVVECPRGVRLDRLKEVHAEQINSVWPFRAPNSVVFVRHLIRFNLSVGAFDEDGNLMAWCLILPVGCLGLLQVENAHKRKGLGSLVVRQLSKWLADAGLEVSAPVVFNNVSSQAMFEKLGFEIIDKVYWSEKPAKIFIKIYYET